MGGSFHCIVACARLGNGTGRRTVTLVAPLLPTGRLVRYEAVPQHLWDKPSGRRRGINF